MKLNKKSYIFKFFKAYERFFTDQEKDDVMGEEILFLTREESEKRKEMWSEEGYSPLILYIYMVYKVTVRFHSKQNKNFLLFLSQATF